MWKSNIGALARNEFQWTLICTCAAFLNLIVDSHALRVPHIFNKHYSHASPSTWIQTGHHVWAKQHVKLWNVHVCPSCDEWHNDLASWWGTKLWQGHKIGMKASNQITYRLSYGNCGGVMILPENSVGQDCFLALGAMYLWIPRTLASFDDSFLRLILASPTQHSGVSCESWCSVLLWESSKRTSAAGSPIHPLCFWNDSN